MADLRRVLAVQEEFSVGDLVRYSLEQEGATDIEVVGTAAAAFDYVRNASPDLLVVDVSHPIAEKLDVCRRLRSTPDGQHVPIIVTAARLSETDRVLALDLGADDCLTRPFGAQEFAARARSLTRRRTSSPDGLPVYEEPRLVADFARLSIAVDGKPLKLTIANRNRVLSRRQLIDRLWPKDRRVDDRAVDVHVGRLRRKLSGVARQVETAFGVGYRFVDETA